MNRGLTLPIRLENVTNLREHWSARHRRVKRQRHEVGLALRYTWGQRQSPPLTPLRVTITRIAPLGLSRPMDGDNLQAACKAVRDEIAAWLRIDDNNPLVTWEYAQGKGAPRQYAVHITFDNA